MPAGRHEGNVTKLPSGSYRARISLDGEPYSRTFPARRAARDWLRDLVERHRRRQLHGRTVAEQLDAYLAAIKGTVEPKTWEEYRHYVVSAYHLGPLKAAPLELLTADEVRAHFARLQEPPFNLGPRTVRQVRGVLSRALRQAVDDGLIERNVVDRVRPPKAPRPKQSVLSRDEQARLLAEAERRAALPQFRGGSRWAGLWWLMLRTGGRLSELIGLTWADVDLEAGTVAISRQLETPAGRRPTWKERTKRPASTRVVQLPRSVVEALRRHRARQDGEKLRFAGAYSDYGLVFCTRHGAPLTREHVRKAWRVACAHAGVTVVRPHDARHTAASSYLAAGTSVPNVAAILGHASPAVTMAVYAHAGIRSTRHDADRLDAFLDGDDGEGGGDAPEFVTNLVTPVGDGG